MTPFFRSVTAFLGLITVAACIPNYVGTPENLAYGQQLSQLTGGAHLVVDTSRNGNGAPDDHAWCNPDGRAVGVRPTTDTGVPTCDAFLLAQAPGRIGRRLQRWPPRW